MNVTESTELELNVQDTSICEGQTVVLSVGTFDSYEWSTSENTPTITVSAGGAYSVTVSDGQGCTGQATITVDEYQEPFADVTPAAEACNTTVDGSTIDFSALITGGDTGGTWTDLDGSGASGGFPVLDFDGVTPGNYRFEYRTNSATPPCVEATYVVNVTILDCTCPSPEIMAPQPLCADNGSLDLSTLLINGVTQPGGSWSIITVPAGSNPAELNGTIFDATGADAGLYEIQYTLTGLPGGCVDNDVQQLVVNAPVDAGVAAEPAQVCVGDDETIDLGGLITGGDSGGMWIETSVNPSMGGFNAATGEFRTALELPGSYTFEYIVTGTAPCPDASTTVEVVVEDVPVADAGANATLTCDITSVELGGNGSSQGPDFRYLWTTTNGQVTDSTSLFTTVKKSGTYTLMVENTVTGCRSFDDVVVNVDGDIPTDVIYDLQFPLCEGEPPAVFNVQSVTGGTPPYTYSLNGGAATGNPIFPNLAPGNYTLVVTDAQGCEIETDFSIPVPTSIDGAITGGTTVGNGEEVSLSYLVSVGVADSVVWYDPDGAILCNQCDSLVFVPEGSTQVFLTMFDANECNVTLSTTINVITRHDLFVPNVFSPNDDGANDFVTVYGPEGLFVNKFEIFSRWGEKVYSQYDFLANQPGSGWDGTFAGRELLPGVYVYHGQVTYPDGFEEIIKGDITLVR